MKQGMKLAALALLGLSLTACARSLPTAGVVAPRALQAKSLAGVTAAVKTTLSQEFREQDRDQNGELQLVEFKGSALHVVLFEAGVQALNQTEAFKALDKDGSGSVSLPEFVGPLVAEKAIAQIRSNVAGMFKTCDRNHDGFVTQGEFGPSVPGEAVPLVDRDGDKKVDLSEYEDALLAGLLPAGVGQADPAPAPAPAAKAHAK